jgi:hypothetical protein
MRQIDVFGTLRVDGQTRGRARLIEIDGTTMAAFHESDPDGAPTIFTTLTRPRLRGRLLSAELIGGGLLEFQKASCGCQTPTSLRGPQHQFTSRVPAPAET